MTRIVLRAVALVIALAAFVDPTISSARSGRRAVAVVAARLDDSIFADRIAHDLSGDFDVVRAPVPGVIASVVAGDVLPAARDIFTSPVIAVPNGAARTLIERIDLPANAPLGGRVPVIVSVRNDASNRIDVVLRANGVRVDHQPLDAAGTARLSFVPAAAGATRVQVEVTSGRDSTTADAVVNVTDMRWPVLFYDARASWISTFVRRAIERDGRFDATSRVVTSRSISRDVGTPPARLVDALGQSFNAIVVGAPDALTADDIGGLDAFMRQRGGAVVLLLDSPPISGALARLTGAVRWDSATFTPATAATLPGDDSTVLRATEIAWPSALPVGAQPLHVAQTQPVIWTVPIGAGELIVSGALDAWRYRDAANSTFDGFWRSTIARAAASALPPIDVRIAPNAVTPGDSAVVTVTSRDELLRGSGSVSIAASLDDSTLVRVWPTSTVGELRGTFRAPRTTGVHHVSVTVNGKRITAPLIVGPDVRQPRGRSGALLAAWATSTGGVALTSDRSADIATAIRKVRTASTAAEPWHPMRSGWWMLPFALALAGEWWLRRRRGLR